MSDINDTSPFGVPGEVLNEKDMDAPTGLLNMECFIRLAADIQKIRATEKTRIIYIFFNIENFRVIHAESGLYGSDHILRVMGNCIQRYFPNSLAAHYIGEYFVVMTEQEDVEETIRIFHDTMWSQTGDTHVEIKAGLYVLQNTTIPPVIACEYAKTADESIRNEYDCIFCYYDVMMDDTLKRRDYIVRHIDSAIKKKHLIVYYQPIICGGTQHICGAEALARWDDPEYGFMVPNEFIVTLENARLIAKLDFYIIELVCRDYWRLKGQTGDLFSVSVNLSRIDFEQHNVLKRIEKIRTQYKVPREYLKLEITERSFGNEQAAIRRQVHELRQHGYHVWMDDFGSGLSSLSLLHELEFDLIKFDLHFLTGPIHTAQRKIIMSSLIHMIKRLGVKTLAEGVETEEQYRFLQDIGCEHMQGYYFSKPVSLEKFLKLL